MDKLKKIKQAVDHVVIKGDPNAVAAFFSNDYVAHAGSKTNKGHSFIIKFGRQLRAAIPNIKIINIEILSQTTNVVTWQRSFEGIHKGDMKGIPASNKKVRWYEIVVSRFEKDKIIEEWLVSDLAFQLMLKQ